MIDHERDVYVFGTYDRGVPNKERMVLRVNRPTNLMYYGVLIGVKAKDNTVVPVKDEFFWLGRLFMDAPSWLFIYTGSGDSAVSQETHTKEPLQVLYWEKQGVVFSNENVIPVLVRFDQFEWAEKNKDLTYLTQPPPSPTSFDDFYKMLTDAGKKEL